MLCTVHLVGEYHLATTSVFKSEGCIHRTMGLTSLKRFFFTEIHRQTMAKKWMQLTNKAGIVMSETALAVLFLST